MIVRLLTVLFIILDMNKADQVYLFNASRKRHILIAWTFMIVVILFFLLGGKGGQPSLDYPKPGSIAKIHIVWTMRAFENNTFTE